MLPRPRIICTDKPGELAKLVKRSTRAKKNTGRERAKRLQFRADASELDAWTLASAREGYLSLSDWVRDRLNKAAKFRALMSSEDTSVNTPPIIIDAIAGMGPIALDPCSNAGSIVPARINLQLPHDDGLAADWRELVARAGGGIVFVNPPYGDELGAWSAKCALEASRGVEIVMLVPARVETQWFDALERYDVAFWRGRIVFKGAPTSAPFPICLPFSSPSLERRALFRAELAPRCTRYVEAA